MISKIFANFPKESYYRYILSLIRIMQNLELTKHEKMELEKRGFFVKELVGFTRYIGLFIFNIFVGFLFGLAGSLGLGGVAQIFHLGINEQILVYLPFALIILLITISSYFYITLGKIFFSKNNILTFGGIYDSINNFIKKLKWIRLFQPPNDNPRLEIITLIGIFPILSILGVISNIYFGTSSLFFYLPFYFSFGFPIVNYLLRQLIEHFHPLYAFGNLGEKIQSLTPHIEQQSKEIQENFEKEMNFSILHAGFEKLSSTFSQIVSLVLKLENIEKKANKGNLFDSTKYINSLRSDILAPLILLRSFLEKQKEELMNSQQELSRVRVGGSEEESANRELASKRSESLMIELEKNIISLDDMILKMR